KESVFSRAYFHFKSMEAVIAFHQGFDGHAFVDSFGNDFRAVVEFALYQKLPKEHKTADARQGTIDQDQDYLEFLESLKAEEKAQ
ncbi:regulator of nonsense-mediated decay, partial [Parasitella parasitica]